jgi:ubiquinone biosynthesis protein
MRFFRLLKISTVVIRHGLDEFLPSGFARTAIRMVFFWRRLPESRAVRLRFALESLGPIFIKFGQILSTRPDLVPHDIASELARLQDRVPPFGEAAVEARLREAFDGKDGRADQTWRDIFSAFDMTPIASASIAQVHFATIADDNPVGKHGGREVAVKILRPDIHEAIQGSVPKKWWLNLISRSMTSLI